MTTWALPSAAFHPLGNLFHGWVSHLHGVLAWLMLSPSQTTPSDRSEDLALVQAALSGDEGFERLVRTYEKLVYRVAFRFVGNETDACDVAQEVFLRVHRALPKFRGDSALSTWIYAITANLSRNALRSRKNREKVQVLAPKEEEGARPFWDRAPDPRASASRGTESKELGEALQKALSELPVDYREAVILRDLEDMDYERIAEALGTNLGTVKSRIARGRAILREKLERYI
jgi:RNA polymerase sigma-70 factor (ECF subfamily)